MEFTNLKKQQELIKEDLNSRIQQVLSHGQYIMGPEVAELEIALSNYVETDYCVTVSSGTEALLISLMAIGIKPGDEVITTPFTFISTAEVIVLLGAIPVFADIEADTACIDALKIEPLITANTKAVMPVSIFGQPSDMDKINQIASSNDIIVIEDAAQSFGATYKNKKSCNLSHIGCTSFFPSKPLGCYGDGGAIFTNNSEIAETARAIRIHGQKQRYIHTIVGVGGRMDTLQAAIVLAKLKYFEKEIDQRQTIGNRYNDLIDSMGIQRIQQRSEVASTFAQYTIQLDERDQVQAYLKQEGIPTAVYYPIPLNQQPAYSQFNNNTPIAEALSKRVLSLPMGPYLTQQEQDQVLYGLTQAF